MFVGFPLTTIKDKKADNIHEYTEVVLVVLQKAKKQDYVGIAETIERCKTIAYQLLSKIMHDRTRYDSPYFVHGFDANSVKVSIESGSSFQLTDYGVRVEFTMHQSIQKQLTYDPQQWT